MGNPVQEKRDAFALRVVKLDKHLTVSKKELVLSKQVLRSGGGEEAVQTMAFADFTFPRV